MNILLLSSAHFDRLSRIHYGFGYAPRFCILMKQCRSTCIYDHTTLYLMDAFDCIETKLDVREFVTRDVSREVRREIFKAARATGTGLNTQHWRFIMIAEKTNLEMLAQDSTSGNWVSGANFAIIVLTNPKYGFHLIDAGRVVQNMQLAAWSRGVASCLFTGMRESKLRRDFGIPEELTPTVIVGFGYPRKILSGKKKNRLPLETLVYNEKYA